MWSSRTWSNGAWRGDPRSNCAWNAASRSIAIAVLVASVAGGGCGTDISVNRSNTATSLDRSSLEVAIRTAAFDQGLRGSPKLNLPELRPAEQALVEKRAALGRFLFHDKALSGKQQTSCATCHHPAFHGADGQPIARGVYCTSGDEVSCTAAPPDGEGGNVVGPGRSAPLNERNSPSVVNTALFPRLMADGRFRFVDTSSLDVNALDPTLGFDVRPPEGVLFTRSLLAAQAFKPVPSIIEMAGDFPFQGQGIPPAHIQGPAVQKAIAERLDGFPAYRELFEEAYPPGQRIFPTDPVIGKNDPITFWAIADAMATWEERALVMTDSAWDEFLLGDDDAIGQSAKRGALAFFTTGKCSTCHAGDLFTDFENHNIGVPQVGPGTGNSDPDRRYQGYDTYDFGREVSTGERADRFKFRTPPLRGVTLTPPYMHNGAYVQLADAIRHHVDPRQAYARYDESQLPPAVRQHGVKPAAPVFAETNPVAIGPGTTLEIRLSDDDVRDLVAFLRTLTDPAMLELPRLAPKELPSGLPADVVGSPVHPLFQ